MMKKYAMKVEGGLVSTVLVWHMPFQVERVCLDGTIPAGAELVLADALASDFARRMLCDGEIAEDELDLSGLTGFRQRVLWTLRVEVPRGRVTTYGRLAELAGHPGASRAVGQVMRMNPLPLVFPCHRVLCGGGLPGGFMGGHEDGLALKLRLLSGEGIVFSRGRVAGEVMV